jgi:hypothetical protein
MGARGLGLEDRVSNAVISLSHDGGVALQLSFLRRIRTRYKSPERTQVLEVLRVKRLKKANGFGC